MTSWPSVSNCSSVANSRRADSLVSAFTLTEIVTGTDVRGVRVSGEEIAGVVTDGGDTIDARIVVANVDAEHLYADLLPDDIALRRPYLSVTFR